VETFHQSICLGMVGGGGLVMNVEEGTEVGPKGGSKLRATIRSDNCRKAKAGYPGRKEGISTIGGGGGGKWDNFRPAGSTIYDGEEVGKTMGRRKWAN
jgi:hypothetical protein